MGLEDISTPTSTIPETKPYDAKSHSALEDSPAFAQDVMVDGKYVGKEYRPKHQDEDGWGPLGVRSPGTGYSAGRR